MVREEEEKKKEKEKMACAGEEERGEMLSWDLYADSCFLELMAGALVQVSQELGSSQCLSIQVLRPL